MVIQSIRVNFMLSIQTRCFGCAFLGPFRTMSTTNAPNAQLGRQRNRGNDKRPPSSLPRHYKPSTKPSVFRAGKPLTFPSQGQVITPLSEDVEEQKWTTKRIQVPATHHGIRLDKFLQEQWEMKRSILRSYILKGRLALEGMSHAVARYDPARIRPQATLNAGDQVVLTLLRKRSNPFEGNDENAARLSDQRQEMVALLKRNVLYKDADIIALNKPAGLAVQPGSRTDLHLEMVLPELQYEATEPPKIVHRLDKDASGVLILARSKEAARRLSALFASNSKVDSRGMDSSDDEGGASSFQEASSSTKQLEKTYIALVAPSSKLPKGQSGRIVDGLVCVGKAPFEKMTTIEWHEGGDNVSPSPTGHPIRRAETMWTVLASSKHACMVQLQPVTGRKHQLRVHCALELRSSILGDYKYGPGCFASLAGMFPLARGSRMKRAVPLHLHMRRLVLKDWWGGESGDLVVEAPFPLHFVRTCRSIGLPLVVLSDVPSA